MGEDGLDDTLGAKVHEFLSGASKNLNTSLALALHNITDLAIESGRLKRMVCTSGTNVTSSEKLECNFNTT
jgi:hypothetical protein